MWTCTETDIETGYWWKVYLFFSFLFNHFLSHAIVSPDWFTWKNFKHIGFPYQCQVPVHCKPRTSILLYFLYVYNSGLLLYEWVLSNFFKSLHCIQILLLLFSLPLFKSRNEGILCWSSSLSSNLSRRAEVGANQKHSFQKEKEKNSSIKHTF